MKAKEVKEIVKTRDRLETVKEKEGINSKRHNLLYTRDPARLLVKGQGLSGG